MPLGIPDDDTQREIIALPEEGFDARKILETLLVTYGYDPESPRKSRLMEIRNKLEFRESFTLEDAMFFGVQWDKIENWEEVTRARVKAVKALIGEELRSL